MAPALTINWTALDFTPRTSSAPQAWPSSWALSCHWSSLVAQALLQVKMFQYGLQFGCGIPWENDPISACLQVHSCWHCAFKAECPLSVECIVLLLSYFQARGASTLWVTVWRPPSSLQFLSFLPRSSTLVVCQFKGTVGSCGQAGQY